jgi:quinol monooxygenase YgiN
MIHVIATITLAEGTRERFLEAFNRIVPPVRAEDGCLAYGAAVDLATGLPAQPPLRPDTVVVVEAWRDLDALRAHLVAPHMTPYRAEVKPFVASLALQVLTPASP